MNGLVQRLAPSAVVINVNFPPWVLAKNSPQREVLYVTADYLLKSKNFRITGTIRYHLRKTF